MPAPVFVDADADAETTATPLFLERREGTDRRQSERRGLESLRTEYQRSLLANAEEPEEAPSPNFVLPFGLKPSRLALILVAVMAGGVAAYLAISREPAASPTVAAPVEAVAPPTTKVLVAKTIVAIGQRLKEDAVEWQDWPDTALQSSYITDAANPDAIKQMTGRMVRATFYAGEPIRPEKLASGDGGLLSSILDKGMRGVSVQITAESASGGFVLPEDRVDVMLTRAAADGRPELETLLRNVRVLAINANLGSQKDSAEADNSSAKGFSDLAIATLELNEAQSRVVIQASTMGKLSLTLRSNADAPTSEATDDQAADAAIRISSPFWTR